MKFLLIILLISSFVFAQQHSEYQKKFIWDREEEILTADFSSVSKPQWDDFEIRTFHFDPVRQDTTGTCWAFASTSHLESEIFRMQGKQIKLSEMYFVYWEYVEKARRFIREKGESLFAQGSEANATLQRIAQYGLVPAEAYSALLPGFNKHNHTAMVREMREYLEFLKTRGYWDEEVALTSIKAILNKHLGTPPLQFEYEGENYTPQSFNDQVCKINPDDYADFMSTLKIPFYTRGEYNVPDNWWHSDQYHNVPLGDFYTVIKSAIQNGYSVALGGDVSEPGKHGWEDIAIIVPWDLPQDAINQDAREFRFYNKTSTDDHLIHLVGYTEMDGHDWFLIKDSGSSSHYGQWKGYYFFREDYIKLKMLTFTVHKDAVKDLLERFQ